MPAAAIHPPSGRRPGSALDRNPLNSRPGSARRHDTRPGSARAPGDRVHSARAARPQSAREFSLAPHPPAQPPPRRAPGGGYQPEVAYEDAKATRPGSGYRQRFIYQAEVNAKQDIARKARVERDEERRLKAEEEQYRKEVQARRLKREGGAVDRESPETASEPEDPVDEPVGSFQRRKTAHSEVMRNLKQAPPMGHQWGELNRGLGNLFRLRPSLAGKVGGAGQKPSSMMGGFRKNTSAPIPSQAQKALRRQMGVLDEFYEVGAAGRVLGEVDKSFRKRRANPKGVTKEWVQDVDKKREQLAPWATSDPQAVFGRQTESVAQRRDRLRAEMALKRRERETKMTGGDGVETAFTLKTNEHASLGLQLALQREARDAKNEEARVKEVRPLGAHVPTATENKVAACIVPLCAQGESKSVEVQRDVAAALYSLSIADENKPAFVEAQALETLIMMAQSKDPDVRRNIAGAMYRLSMCSAIKRAFVVQGVLRPLLVFSQGSKDREVQRYSMLAIKELCEKRANHVDIIDAHALPILFAHCRDSTDPRIRKEAIWTLNFLADDESNRLRMLKAGALDFMLEFVQRRDDLSMRRGSSSALLKFSQLKEIAPADVVKQLTAKPTLSALIAGLQDRDLDVSSDLCKTLIVLKSTKLTRMMLTQDGLTYCFAHASRLVELDGTGEIHANLTQVMTVLLAFMPAKYPKNVMAVMDKGYMSTLLQLCKYNSGKVRRSAGKLLARLSTIEASKEKMMSDPETVPLLISLCKQRDYSSQMTAVKVIAELAEEAKNRKPLYLAAVMPTLFECIRKGDDEMRFQCARAIADMAEAVELRVGIVYAGLEQILECMLSDDDAVQEQGMRILVNLAAPAGFACGAEEGGVGRYGALEALQVDDDDSDDSSSGEDDSGASGDEYETASDGSVDSDASDDEDSSDEAGMMDAIANQMDDMELHRADSPDHDKPPPAKDIPAGMVVSGGLMGLAMGMAPAAAGGAEDSSSEEEEDDYDEPETTTEEELELQLEEEEEDDDEEADPPSSPVGTSNVLARARLLVHKAAIMEGEKSRGTKAGEASLLAATKSAAKKKGGMAKGVSKPGKFKAAKPVATESQFSRYRRQSAFTINEEKRVEAAEEAAKIKATAAAPRRASVGWGDMAMMVGASADGSVDEQSHEWWSTDEGKKFQEKHNTINVDRIHLKIAESNVVKRLLELVFDDTPHVSEYAERVISFMVTQGMKKADTARAESPT